jgi:hypothetical protein
METEANSEEADAFEYADTEAINNTAAINTAFFIASS